MASRKAAKKAVKRKKRKVKIPPSPIDRMGWSGKSRKVRLRVETDYVKEAEYDPDD